MIEVPEEFIEAVLGRQMLVVVAEMVLAELPGRITLRLHDVGNCRHPIRDAMGIAGHADGEQAGAERLLAEDERCASGGAALLPVGIGEDRSFLARCGRCWACGTHHAHV